ncbi:MAG: hypothetical protein JZU50_02650 [Desulfobulbaceae bacterium]|jgi:hypothetical protein|nr:hypothetical protein [Desulfobulbaceae bacterium]
MRKKIVSREMQAVSPIEQIWLDIDRLAQIEFSSENPAYPIENALLPATGSDWQAAEPGEQIIRLLFDAPIRLSRIRLVFNETQRVRTQEFVLRWSPDGGQSNQEVVRQQYNFSPPDSTREVEDYTVHLDQLTALELSIVPDISGGEARASLTSWQLA